MGLAQAQPLTPTDEVAELQLRLRGLESQDPQNKLSAEMGTLRAWIDALREATGEKAARLRDRIAAQQRLIEALLARNAVSGQLEPMREEVHQLRISADKLAADIRQARDRLNALRRTGGR